VGDSNCQRVLHRRHSRASLKSLEAERSSPVNRVLRAACLSLFGLASGKDGDGSRFPRRGGDKRAHHTIRGSLQGWSEGGPWTRSLDCAGEGGSECSNLCLTTQPVQPVQPVQRYCAPTESWTAAKRTARPGEGCAGLDCMWQSFHRARQTSGEASGQLMNEYYADAPGGRAPVCERAASLQALGAWRRGTGVSMAPSLNGHGRATTSTLPAGRLCIPSLHLSTLSHRTLSPQTLPVAGAAARRDSRR
jgi:hypothetical protein